MFRNALALWAGMSGREAVSVKLTIDHLTLAAHRLELLSEAFDRLNLHPDYGGPHENGVTHMSLIGFADGSYVELFAPREAGAVSPIWNDFAIGDAGPSAWCVWSADATTEADRLRARGVPVRGPFERGRRKPDGTQIRWQLAFPGEASPGAFHPFIIEDLTPKSLRVSASASAAAAGLLGIEAVILAVAELERAVAALRDAYGLGPALACRLPGLDGDAVRFSDAPLVLVRPDDAASPLGRRLARFGDAPCGAVFAVADLAASVAALGLRVGEPSTGGPCPMIRLDDCETGQGSYFALVRSGALIEGGASR